MSANFRLKVITPEKLFFDDETENVIVRTTVGDVGILAKHIDYVAVLPAGPLRVKMPDNTFRVAAVSSGTLKVSKEGVVILATAVEWADEIDIEHAKRSEEDAREKIKIHKSGVEFDRAQLKLKRALNRLSVSQNR